MIRVLLGDLFESKAQTLVNTINCVGIMGKGIALEFKRRFPDMFADYVNRCSTGQVHLGEPYLYSSLIEPWVLNFPTKDHWRGVSRLSDITHGLCYLAEHYREWGITSLACPALGCSNGQLEWRVVGPILYQYLNQLDIPVELFAPLGTPQEQMQMDFLARDVSLDATFRGYAETERIAPAWVALVEIVARIENETYHWPVGHTTFQKMAYFATVEGLPTGLDFVRDSYGPFAKELKPMTTRLVNNGLLVEERMGQGFSFKPGQAYSGAITGYTRELKEWWPIIDRVSDLFLRMNTNDAEIAATVHFVANELSNADNSDVTEEDILNAVLEWKRRRTPQLSPAQIARSIRDLNLLGWINAKPSDALPLDDLLEV